MDYLKLINERFPIRRSPEQKQLFRCFVEAECEKMSCRVQMDTLQGKHTNVVIGDLEKARVVFSAHYDTPATALVPNIMTPRNPLFQYGYHFGYPILLAIFSLLMASGLRSLLALNDKLYILLYLVLYLGLFYFCNRAFPNKHNKNDNTSGVAVILSMAASMGTEKAAYILFDNEEKGLLGSKACGKAYKTIFENKLLVNLDCVGVGEHIITIAKEGAAKLPEYALLQDTWQGRDDFQVHHFPVKGSQSNSDYKSFPCGMGIMACRESKPLGYYTSAIHTNRDTVASEQNIQFLRQSLCDYIDKL